jgi:hypothetical protein
LPGLTSIYERVSGYIDSQRASKAPNTPRNRTVTGLYLPGDLPTYTEKPNTVSTRNSLFVSPNQQPSILNDTDNTLHNPNKRYHPDDGTVLDTRTVQPYEDIATDGASLPQYNHTDEITNNKQNQVPLDVDRYDWQQEPVQEDNQFPFDGYNVEDLWEWMLYFDSQSEVISHAHT